MGTQIVIVGGGVVGLSTAWYASARGHEVKVVDRSPAGAPGCSFGNAGYITPSHFTPLAAPGMIRLALKYMWNEESPFYVKPRLDGDLLSWGWKFYRAATPARVDRAAPVLRDLNLASLACYRDLAGELGNEFGFAESGILNLCATDEGAAHEAALVERANRLGLKAEVVSAGDVEKLEPDVRIKTVGGSYFLQDAILSPAAFMHCLTKRLADRGVTFAWESPVTGWRTSGNRIEAVRTSSGDFEADEFVVCGGAWTPVVARSMGVSLPMQAGKGYSLTLPKPRQMARRGIILVEARVAVTPIGEALRFGGTMEIAGLNETINPARVRGIVRSVGRFFPDFTPRDFDGVEPWCGLRPVSPDGLPYIGRFSRWSNLSVGAGHAMMGMSLGPITGRLINEVLSDEAPSVPLDLLSPDRYAA